MVIMKLGNRFEQVGHPPLEGRLTGVPVLLVPEDGVYDRLLSAEGVIGSLLSLPELPRL